MTRIPLHLALLALLFLITTPILGQTDTPAAIPPVGTPTASEAPTLASPSPTPSPIPDITGPRLNLFWSERFLLLQNPGEAKVDVTQLDLRGGINNETGSMTNSFVDGQTWFRASFQYLEPRRCVFIYQFDFSGGEAPPFLEDAQELMPDVACENDEAYYIGVSAENAVWMIADGEFTASYAGVETGTCDNAAGSCVVPLTVELPDNVVTLFWNADILVLVNIGKAAQDVSDLQLTNGTNSLIPLDEVKSFLSDLRSGQCVVFYGLDISPQPRLPDNVFCTAVVAAQQIAPSDFIWLTGEGFTATTQGVELECDTFSRTSCVLALEHED